MITLLNCLIIFTIVMTFFTLIAGLVYTARSGDDKDNKINKFMKFRVYFQFLAIIILMVSIYIKKQLVS